MVGVPFLGKPRLQNVVIVVVDTLRQDHLECYGYERQTAPEICRLASGGVILDGISPSSWTKPATASILTGLHPITHQAIERNDRLPNRVRTLAEILSDQGYTTLAVSGNGWVSERFGFAQGFDQFFQVTRRHGRPSNAEEINDALLPELADLKPPYFLYVHYVDPHAPYDPPYSWTKAPLAEHLVERAPVTNQDLQMQAFTRRDPQLMQDSIDLYDGEVRAADERIGEMWKRLESLGLTDSTLLIVTSDHGEEFEEHGRVGHGMSLYREVIRVPLVFHSPGIWPDGLVLGRASLMDLVPTVLDFLGYIGEISKGDGVDGVSLLPWLAPGRASDGGSAGGSLDVRPDQPGYVLHLDHDGASSLAFVGQEQKIVLSRGPYRKEIFDLRSDPLEQQNLLRRGALDGLFAQLSERLANGYNQYARRALQRETVEDAAEVTRSLQALGYISPSTDTLKPRLMPQRVKAADSRPGGLLGWEIPRLFQPCVEMSEEPMSLQLLEGWGGVDQSGRGRAVREHASFVLRAPDGANRDNLELRLEGFSNGVAPAQVSVSIHSEPVVDLEVLPGRGWTMNVRVRPDLDDYSLAYLSISVEPGYHPSNPDERRRSQELLLVKKACLVALGEGT
jgi:arylsulfatase A-like enzyme